MFTDREERNLRRIDSVVKYWGVTHNVKGTDETMTAVFFLVDCAARAFFLDIPFKISFLLFSILQ